MTKYDTHGRKRLTHVVRCYNFNEKQLKILLHLSKFRNRILILRYHLVLKILLLSKNWTTLAPLHYQNFISHATFGIKIQLYLWIPKVYAIFFYFSFFRPVQFFVAYTFVNPFLFFQFLLRKAQRLFFYTPLICSGLYEMFFEF